MTAVRRFAIASLVAVSAASMAACGSTDGGKNAAAAAAISQSFLNSVSPSYGLTSSQTSCLGTGIIKDFGTDRAIKYKFLATGNRPVASVTISLPAEDAATFADTFMSCTNATALLKEKLLTTINPKTDEARQQLQTCLNQNLTTSVMRTNLTQAFSGAKQTALNPVVAACNKFG